LELLHNINNGFSFAALSVIFIMNFFYV